MTETLMVQKLAYNLASLFFGGGGMVFVSILSSEKNTERNLLPKFKPFC